MSLINESTVQLRRDEGEKLFAYQDHLGFWTIGIGVLIDERKGGGITKEESAYLFRNRFIRKWDELVAAAPWVLTLSEARQGVLINMAYQMGVQGLMGFKRFLAMVKQGEYSAASKEMLESKWAEQTPERAKRLSKQMRDNIWV